MTKLLNGDEDGPNVRAAERASGRFMGSCPDYIYQPNKNTDNSILQEPLFYDIWTNILSEVLYLYLYFVSVVHQNNFNVLLTRSAWREAESISIPISDAIRVSSFSPVFDRETEGDFENK